MEFIKNHKIIFIIISIIILSAIGYRFLYNNEEKNEINFEENIENPEPVVDEEDVNKIFIDIGGEVFLPGLYELDEGSRINDAINIAGGVTEEAALDDVNLAYVLSDGVKIIIPKKSKDIKSNNKPVIYSSDSNTSQSYININTATLDELCKLSGVGESTAQKIIMYRNENGLFKSKEELKKVQGIGESKFNILKNNITI